jgi:signal transduction histidine kinase/CheY-like chemotaxis protein
MESELTRILLVEDNPGDARLIKEMLAEAGGGTISLDWVPRLADGLDRLSRGEIDLVLLDLGLPDSQGLETFFRAYAHAPKVPFVVLTGLDDETLALTAVREGAQDYLVKGEADGNLILRAVRYALERKRVEEALKAEREKLFTLLDALPAFVYLKSRDYFVRFANRAFKEIFGEVEGKRCFEVQGRSQPCEDCRSFRIFETREPQSFEWSLPNGRTYQVFNYPFCDPEGSLLVLTMGFDITPRKQAEEELRRSEERLAEAQRLAHLGNWDWDFRKDESICSQELFRILKLTPRDRGLSYAEFLSLVHPEDREMVQEAIAETQAARRQYGVDFRVVLADGAVRHLRAEAEIRLDEAGHPARLAGTLQDVTQRRQNELALEAARKFLEIANRQTEMAPLLKEFVQEIQKFSGCSAVGIRLLAEDGSIPYEAYVGFSREFYELESPLSIKSDRCMCINVIQGATDSGKLFHTPGGSFYLNDTSRFLTLIPEAEQGRIRNVCKEFGFESVALVPIYGGPKILGLIHVADPRVNLVPLQLMEVLERVAMQLGAAIQRVKAADSLRESERNLRYLASQLMTAQERERERISRELHDDLGQSLFVLKLQVRALQQKLGEKDTGLRLECQDMAGHLDRLVENVRRLSRDLRPAILEDLGLSTALRRLLQDFSKHNHLSLEIAQMEDIDALLSPEAQINIYRVFQEALTNIGKHAHATRILVEVKRHRGKASFVLADNGKGFRMEQVLAHQGEPGGMGLVSMEERVRMLGGSLAVKSREGHGTRIAFTIPVSNP